jgi:hypothetical protein
MRATECCPWPLNRYAVGFRTVLVAAAHTCAKLLGHPQHPWLERRRIRLWYKGLDPVDLLLLFRGFCMLASGLMVMSRWFRMAVEL